MNIEKMRRANARRWAAVRASVRGELRRKAKELHARVTQLID